MTVPIETTIERALRGVIDPELGENIVDLGLVYGVQVDAAEAVTVIMTLTTPHCPLAGEIERAVREAAAVPGVTAVDVQLVWNPPWTPYRLASGLRAPLGLPDAEPAPPSTVASFARPSKLRRLWRRLRRA